MPLVKLQAKPAPGEPAMLVKLPVCVVALNNLKLSFVVSTPAKLVTVNVPP